ncbi:MAG: LysR family transcriptional regulator [Pseudomonadota bacterium]
MSKLDLDDYRAVLALFERRHFGYAASDLGVTQPSLTSRLKRIEQRLEARLFERGRRGVEPTAVGLALAEAAQDVVRVADDAEKVAKNAALGKGQILRIGFTQIAAQTVVVDALCAFRALHPEVRIRLFEASSLPLERMLEGHLLDVAFLHPPLQTSGLRHKVLLEEAGHRLSFHPDGNGGRVVFYPNADAPNVMTRIAEELEEVSIAPRVEYTADTVLGALVLARAGYGDALVPESFEHPLIDAADHRKEMLFSTALVTAVSIRSTDRRQLVDDLFASAVDVAKAKDHRR